MSLVWLAWAIKNTIKRFFLTNINKLHINELLRYHLNSRL